MKYKVAIKKIDSLGGSPLQWDASTISKMTVILGDMLETAGFNLSGVTGRSVLLHPNLVRPHRSRPSSFTDPRVIIATASLFKDAGARSISVGENPGFGFSARKAFQEAGLTAELGRIGAISIYFDEGEWIKIDNTKGRLYRDTLVAQSVMETDLFVNIPKMKTHMLTHVSLCIKNLLGIIHDDQRILFHRNDIADKVVDLNLIRAPDVNIVDGLWAMEGQAPFHGKAIQDFNVLVVGTESVVVDATCCRIMGFEPGEVPHVQLALKRLLDDWNDNDLPEIIGDSIESVSRRFQRPVISSLGHFDNIDCIECGVCNGCLSAIRHSLDWLKAEDEISTIKKCTVISGRPMPNMLTLEKWDGELILFGNCAAEFQFFDAGRRQKATWIPGCPPHVLDLAKRLKESQSSDQ